jgi:hypothetical protein
MIVCIHVWFISQLARLNILLKGRVVDPPANRSESFRWRVWMNHNGLRPAILIADEGPRLPIDGEADSVVIFASQSLLEHIAKWILRMVHAGLVCDSGR